MGLVRNICVFCLVAMLLFLFSSFARAYRSDEIPASLHLFDCATIDISNNIITHPNCNKSDGAIKGIKVTSSGTKIQYTWVDLGNNNAVVGHSLDLTNIPAGTYRLEVTDNSGCNVAVFSPGILVDNANSIQYDDSNLVITKAGCQNDGSITGIKVNNATTYQWDDLTAGKVVSKSSTTPNVFNLAPGSYQLTVSNATCQAVYSYYVQSAIIVPTVLRFKEVDAPCGGSGTLSVSLKVSPNQPRLMAAFETPDGAHVWDGILTNDNLNPTIGISAGKNTYYLYVQQDQCVVLLGTYKIGGDTLFVDKQNTVITNDRCNQHLGSIVPVITGAQVATKGDQPSYTWYLRRVGYPDSVVGKNKVLTRVGAGKYHLFYQQGNDCKMDADFDITNNSPALVPPKAAGSTICLPGIINITVTNPDTAEVFRLYDSPTDSIPIAVDSNGVFYRQITQTTTYYVSRVHKDCESDRTAVSEVVVADIKIPNAFTPNGDGVNDAWNLEGIEKFPGADVKIFTRSGQLIFHSINYPIAFDGTYGGSPVPGGVYYYIIDVKQPICFGKISGSLTVIR